MIEVRPDRLAARPGHRHDRTDQRHARDEQRRGGGGDALLRGRDEDPRDGHLDERERRHPTPVASTIERRSPRPMTMGSRINAPMAVRAKTTTLGSTSFTATG